MSNVKQNLVSIRDKIARRNRYIVQIYTDEVLDSISNLLTSIKHGPKTVKRLVAKVLFSIAKKVSHRQNIAYEVNVLKKLESLLEKTIQLSTKITVPIMTIALARRLFKINPPKNTPLGRTLYVWSLFTKFIFFIQLTGLALSFKDIKSISNDIQDLANYVGS